MIYRVSIVLAVVVLCVELDLDHVIVLLAIRVTQPIRLVCEYARLPWEEKTYTLKVTGNGCFDASEWKQVKHTLSLDFPNLPWFIDPNTGVKLTQSDASTV